MTYRHSAPSRHSEETPTTSKITRHSERSKDSVQKLTECQVLDGGSLSEIQSISVAYSDLNREILRSLHSLRMTKIRHSEHSPFVILSVAKNLCHSEASGFEAVRGLVCVQNLTNVLGGLSLPVGSFGHFVSSG